MQTIWTSLQTDNHTNTSSLDFYRLDALRDAQPTVTMHWRNTFTYFLLLLLITCLLKSVHTTRVDGPCWRALSPTAVNTADVKRKCADNWHSAGSLGWPFPTLKYKCSLFFKQNIRNRFHRTACGKSCGLKLPNCWLKFLKIDLKYCVICYIFRMPSVLWRFWLGGRKGIQSVENRVVGCWRGYLPGARCRLAYGPADATATHCLLFQ